MKAINKQLFKSDTFIICTWAVALTAILGVIVVWLQGIYFKNYSYFYDPVSYSLENIVLHLRWLSESRFSLALDQALNNSRHPLRTVPIILAAPNLLGHHLGYVVTALPALLSFLVILGLTIRKRSGSMLYALSCCLLFCAIPGLSNLRYGLGTYWLDLVAALFVGSATLCLVCSSGAKDMKWLTSFSVFSALACLSRYTAIAYLLIICAPIFIIYLISQFRVKPFIYRSLVKPILYASIPFLTLSGFFLFKHLPQNYFYYTTLGYDIKQTSFAALSATVNFLVNSFFELPFILVLLAIFISNLLLNDKFERKQYSELLISLWFVISIPLFLTFLGSTDAFHARMYAVPIIFMAAISPVTLSNPQSFTHSNSHLKNIFEEKSFIGLGSLLAASIQGKRKRILRFLSIAIFVMSLIAWGNLVFDNYHVAWNPEPHYQHSKKLDMEISDLLVKEQKANGPIVWLPFFHEYSPMPTADAYYRHGEFVRPSGYMAHLFYENSNVYRDPYFTIHEAYWKGFYPDMSPGPLKRKIYRDTVKLVDIAIVFEEPTWAENIPWMGNPYTLAVAEHVSRKMSQDERWERLPLTLETEIYGNLAVYRNVARLKKRSRDVGH